MTKGNIFDIMKYSIHDGPGIRTTVFLKGCPLNCMWCHNPESQDSKQQIMLRSERCISCGACIEKCTNNALEHRELCTACGRCTQVCHSTARELVGRMMSVGEVLEEVKKDIIFYDESGGGVTFSGGEPLLQPEFLIKLLQQCKENEIHTAIETTGYAKFEILHIIAEYTDLFLYDLKIMDSIKHKKYTGVSNELILENLRQLTKIHNNIIIRIPIIPGINDDLENIEAVGEFLESLNNIAGVNILPYHQTGVDKYMKLGREYQLSGIVPPDTFSMERIANKLNEYRFKVKIGG